MPQSAQRVRAPAPPRLNAIRSLLLSELGRLLCRDLDPEDDGRSFTALGVDSLSLIQFIDFVDRRFGIRPSNRRFLDDLGSTRAVAEYVDQALPPGQPPPEGPVAPAEAAGDDRDPFLPFPFPDLQQAYWYGRKGVFELGDLPPHAWFEWEGPDLDPRRLRTAWNQLVRRHGVLRAVAVSDEQMQILADVPDCDIGVEDLSAGPPAEIAARLAAARREMAEMPGNDLWPLFDLRLLRLPAGQCRLFLRFDLVILDGRGLRVLLDEWSRLYARPDAPPPRCELTYRRFALMRQAEKATPAYAASRAFWQSRLDTLPPAPDLPLVADPALLRGYRMRHHERTFDAALWHRFKETAQGYGLTATAAACAVFSDVIRAWSANEAFTLDVLVDSRPGVHPDAATLVGSCTSTLLLEIQPGATFLDRARIIQERLWTDLEHVRVSGIEVLRDLNRRRGVSGSASMPVVFSSEIGFAPADGGAARFPGSLVAHGVQTPYVLFDQQVRELDGALVLDLDVVEEAFPKGLPTRMLQAFQDRLTVLGTDAAAWSSPTAGVLPAGDRALIAEANATDTPIPGGLLHEPFFERAVTCPAAPAVIDRTGLLTYGELAARAHGVAHWLRARQAGPNQLVAIVMRKGWQQVAAVLGIGLAGGAYLPIDPAWPVERIRSLLRRCAVKTVLTDADSRDAVIWPEDVVPAVVECLPRHNEGPPPITPATQPHDLAYVIFTSGSTGEPKGVMIDHRGARNTVADISRRFGVGPADSVLGLSSLSFDLSVYDIFGVLGAGGALVLPDPQRQSDPAHWCDLALRHRVTLWNTVPALFDVFVEFNRTDPRALTGIRLAMLSGDWIAPDLPHRVHALNPDLDLISLGGATEGSIWSIWHPIELGRLYATSIPYGKALYNQKMYVLDGGLEPRPVGVPGEIFIGGIGVTKGYWAAPDLSAERLITSPHTGEVLYRTGDLGRLMADGNIEFLGRADFQVKIRGFRVELAEIEAMLAGYPGIRACAVTAPGPARGAKRLIAHIVAARPDARPAEQELAGFLKTRLPAYMIPEAFIFHESLPRSANGKVDRKALPIPEAARLVESGTGLRDDDPLIARIAATWADVLDSGTIGPDDDFYDLGGNSLAAMRIQARLRDAVSEPMTLAMLFQRPTVAGMAATLRGTERAERSTVIRMRSGNPVTPIYLVHPIGGNVLCYAALERALGGDQTVFGIQAVGLDGTEPPLEEIGKMARRYLSDIRRLAPPAGGGWCLAGWSLGGLIAFEMARLLVEAGEGPVQVVVIDGRLDEAGGTEMTDQRDLLNWFARDLGQGRHPVLLDTAESQAPSPDPFDLFIERAHSHNLLPRDTETGQVRVLFDVFSKHARALSCYRPDRLALPVDVILAGGGAEAGTLKERAEAWRRVTCGHASIRVVDTDHYGIVAAPGAETVTEVLRNAWTRCA